MILIAILITVESSLRRVVFPLAQLLRQELLHQGYGHSATALLISYLFLKGELLLFLVLEILCHWDVYLPHVEGLVSQHVVQKHDLLLGHIVSDG